MPMFEAITPVRSGGKTIQPGKPVELDAETGATLLALGAVGPGPIATPAPPPPPPPAEKPLSQMNKAELRAIVQAEGVSVADDAPNKLMVAAIEAKRSTASRGVCSA